MDYASSSTALVFDLKTESPFSFKCQVCSACCYNKAIQAAPYEALHLSRNLGLTTTEFYRTCTEDGGIVLRNRPDGSCIFLGPGGCSVHPDRPLVCRLFPLGQITDREGRTRYAVMPLHPDCLGHFDVDGTVESYLESQEVGPYFHRDAVYEAVSKRVLKILGKPGKVGTGNPRPGKPQPAGPDFSSCSMLPSRWLDIDAAVAEFCRTKRRYKPTSPDDVVSLHLEAIEEWLSSLKKRRRPGHRRKNTSPL